MKKMLVVASLLGSMMLGGPQFAAPVHAQALGELCWNILPVTNPIFGDVSRLRLAITAAGTTWLLSGRWNYYHAPDLAPAGTWTTVAVSGAMAREYHRGGGLEISLHGFDYADNGGIFGDFRFHAKINQDTGNGTWERIREDGIVVTGTLTVVPLTSCP